MSQLVPQVRKFWFVTSATFPALAPMAMVPMSIGGGQVLGAAGARGLLDEEVLPGVHDPGSDVGPVRPRHPGGRRVLHRPPGDVHGRGAAVEQLDEVVPPERARVAAPAVHLADHDVRRDHPRGLGADRVSGLFRRPQGLGGRGGLRGQEKGQGGGGTAEDEGDLHARPRARTAVTGGPRPVGWMDFSMPGPWSVPALSTRSMVPGPFDASTTKALRPCETARAFRSPAVPERRGGWP